MVRDIPGYEGLYTINHKGKIKSKRTGRVLKSYNDRGYHIIRLSRNGRKKTYGVKQLIKMTFDGRLNE